MTRHFFAQKSIINGLNEWFLLRRFQRIFSFLIRSTKMHSTVEFKDFQQENGSHGNGFRGIPRQHPGRGNFPDFRREEFLVPAEQKRGIFGEFPRFF